MISDEFLYAHLDTAARLVANPDGDTQNAWDVLVDRVGEKVATTLVLAEDGGREALVTLGVLPALTLTIHEHTATPDDMVELLHHIGDQISAGYTSGYHPGWSLDNVAKEG